jgi:hypothetical protein
MAPTRSVALACTLAIATLALPATGHAAEALLAATAQNRLVVVHSDSPTSLRSSVELHGLASSDYLVGLDTLDSSVFGLSRTGRLYAVDADTGELTQIGTGAGPEHASALGFGIDPGARTGRIVTDFGESVGVDLADGTRTPSAGLRYAADDPNAGLAPVAVAVAFPGPATPGMYLIDAARGVLAQQVAGSDTLRTVGGLGMPVGVAVTRQGFDITAFDISSSDIGWAVLAPGSDPSSATEKPQGLYRLDLATGNAVAAGAGFDLRLLTALAATGTVPDDQRRPRLMLKLNRRVERQALLKRGALRTTVVCDEACTATVRLRLRGREIVRTSTTLQPLEGRRRELLRFRLTAKAKKVLRAHSSSRLTVRFTAVDGAGNRSRVSRRVRVVAD